MNLIIKITILFFSIQMKVLGAGDSGHAGSVTDLMFPALNFFLLLSFLVWKIKKPLRDMFDKNAEEVTNLYEYAEKRDKEAKIKLEMFQKKMENLDSEKQKILKNAEREAKDFETKTTRESVDYLERLKKDSVNKLEHEKVSLQNDIEENLVNEVIKKTKETIGNDKALGSKATHKLLAQIK